MCRLPRSLQVRISSDPQRKDNPVTTPVPTSPPAEPQTSGRIMCGAFVGHDDKGAAAPAHWQMFDNHQLQRPTAPRRPRGVVGGSAPTVTAGGGCESAPTIATVRKVQETSGATR